MKTLLPILCIFASVLVRAQDYTDHSFAVKAGGGYAHDFPGLNGYAVFTEVSRPLSDRLQGAIGVKLINMNGHPRTTQVSEYTKATTLDFNIYFVPLATDMSELRIGAGYSFSFYKIQRSYPVITNHGGDRETTWPLQNKQGRVSGVTLTGEYEYFIPETNFSLGCRASLLKAYDRVTFVGVFGAVRL
ncbi:MAG TPA: hypothetical protein VD993_11955 [Chitinophagaceae bacterium]|nr:hypothetical protein [Chitinophagaceae bacterium]